MYLLYLIYTHVSYPFVSSQKIVFLIECFLKDIFEYSCDSPIFSLSLVCAYFIFQQSDIKALEEEIEMNGMVWYGFIPIFSTYQR